MATYHCSLQVDLRFEGSVTDAISETQARKATEDAYRGFELEGKGEGQLGSAKSRIHVSDSENERIECYKID